MKLCARPHGSCCVFQVKQLIDEFENLKRENDHNTNTLDALERELSEKNHLLEALKVERQKQLEEVYEMK